MELEVAMRIVQSVSVFLTIEPNWSADWAWGIPLIVLTVLIHTLSLFVISKRAIRAFHHRPPWLHPTASFVVIMGSATLLTTVLHGLEAILWAAAYRILGALPDNHSAILYSLNAITSYGHTNLSLSNHWHLMGALEALSGWLLFGLTTAFLFYVIQRVLVSEGT
jgi:hypothetical protein